MTLSHAFGGIGLALAVLLTCASPLFAEQPHDDLSLFLSKFGQPDRTESSETEKPRPPIVTKRLTYLKERVRAVYVPDAPVGAPPPYRNWKLFGFQDSRTNEVISPKEVAQRLQGRTKR